MSVEQTLQILYRHFGNHPFQPEDLPDNIVREIATAVGAQGPIHRLVKEWMANHNGSESGWGTSTYKRLIMVELPNTYVVQAEHLATPMSAEQLATILRDSVDTSPDGEKVSRILLFGIRYAPELGASNLANVRRLAGIPNWPEINKGIALAQYVTNRE